MSENGFGLDSDDELQAAAIAEEADRVARRDRTRAWLVSITASAAVILLAVGVLVLLYGPADRPSAARPIGRPPIVIRFPIATGSGSSLVEAIVALDTVRLPAGWSRQAGIGGAACAVQCLVGDLDNGDRVTWSAAWVAPAGSPHPAADVAAALTAAGWQPCRTSPPGQASCWRKASLQLTVSPVPGGPCADGSGATCPAFSVSVVVGKP